MITPTQCCDYFDLMACHLPPRYPLLPAGPSRPAQQYAIGLKVRVPLGVRECPVVEAQYRNERWWYAFDIHDGCRKWYAEQSLCPVLLIELERAA